jgi:hypothetical protein
MAAALDTNTDPDKNWPPRRVYIPEGCDQQGRLDAGQQLHEDETLEGCYAGRDEEDGFDAARGILNAVAIVALTAAIVIGGPALLHLVARWFA